jgi:hypothetical protein
MQAGHFNGRPGSEWQGCPCMERRRTIAVRPPGTLRVWCAAQRGHSAGVRLSANGGGTPPLQQALPRESVAAGFST